MVDQQWIKLAHSAFFFMQLVTGAFMLYADIWTGTGKEMVVICALVFGVAMSNNSILGMFTRLKVPGA
ncbi:hypothetical protein [Pseudoduganella buxea]|uniref:Uncharacterized protein n=1 Tax=Pseudoduganella buxea TaxID=1949069 RepID=A0A6I3T4M7_9BURK|nr:hypothetical protein [Pseudoduganella buxea]MTV56379.1 hypothetical protein [Pseudoduganella buxea]GGC25518.1 hypothetical protein GCM10011572_53620 [Pseudoduganella buxea]